MYALVWSVVLGGGLQLGDIDDAAECRLNRHIPDALTRVMPSLPLGKRPTTEGDIYVSLEAMRPDSARLRLKNARGNLLLARDLPVMEGLCTSVADMVALITERYLRDIGWEPTADGLPDIPRGTRTVKQTAESFDWAPHLEGLDLGLRAGAELNGKTRWGGGVWLRLPLGAWEASLGVTGLGLASEPVLRMGDARGEFRVWSLAWLLAAGVCGRASGGHQLCADLVGGGEWLFGEASGSGVFQGTPATQAQPLIAWEARYEYGFGDSPMAALLGVRAALRPWAVGFSVEDADSGFQSPEWTVTLEAGFWWQAL